MTNTARLCCHHELSKRQVTDTGGEAVSLGVLFVVFYKEYSNYIGKSFSSFSTVISAWGAFCVQIFGVNVFVITNNLIK